MNLWSDTLKRQKIFLMINQLRLARHLHFLIPFIQDVSYAENISFILNVSVYYLEVSQTVMMIGLIGVLVAAGGSHYLLRSLIKEPAWTQEVLQLISLQELWH